MMKTLKHLKDLTTGYEATPPETLRYANFSTIVLSSVHSLILLVS